MSDTKRTKQTATVKLPTHIAYQVRDREGQKAIWTRIGAVFAHADNKGFHIQLAATPLDGRIVLRVPLPKNA